MNLNDKLPEDEKNSKVKRTIMMLDYLFGVKSPENNKSGGKAKNNNENNNEDEKIESKND